MQKKKGRCKMKMRMKLIQCLRGHLPKSFPTAKGTLEQFSMTLEKT